MTVSLLCDNLIFVADNNDSTPATGFSPAVHFGKQVRKARRAKGWSIHELAQRSGISAGHLSHIENGNKAPTERIAMKLDIVFPERQGWFTDYHRDSRSWTKPGYRDWSERELSATALRAWTPGLIHGYVQTQDYAYTLLSKFPGVPQEVAAERLKARMRRQERVLYRDNPPTVWLLVDELALYRCVGSPEIMVGQCDRLIEVASLPDVTVQVLPAPAQPAGTADLSVTDGAAYTENAVGGSMYTDIETVSSLSRLFNTMQAESLRASESMDMFGRMREAWTRGGRVLTPEVTEDRASR